MAEIHHLKNRHDVIFCCWGWSDLSKILQIGAQWHVDCSDMVKHETRWRIPIWQTFGRITWHVMPVCECQKKYIHKLQKRHKTVYFTHFPRSSYWMVLIEIRLWGALVDVINCAELCSNCLRGCASVGGENLPSPIEFTVNTLLALLHSLWQVVNLSKHTADERMNQQTQQTHSWWENEPANSMRQQHFLSSQEFHK